MSTVLNAVVRDATTSDHTTAVEVLVGAFADGATACWAAPDPLLRTAVLDGYFTALLGHTLAYGTVRLAEIRQQVAGVAVWLPYPPAPGTPDVHDLGDEAADLTDPAVMQAAQRLHALERLLRHRHPTTAHHYLAYLGVHPAQQNRGVGNLLLHDHLTRLDPDAPAYLEAGNPRCRRLYLRHGFTDHGEPVTTLGSPAVHPMWRPATGSR
ncbi:GNAT family N-acetyltransferase [Mangrovihabitans endophyticus]|uniref:N-acetyltransferase n=1 Tax=Mangrovihabitans endophyticus TaxID=1751298 RepID=A0A8J3C5F4_9ACTN|nr:GNAT family N-acetyltransferase [Mangrovihabitans endophyticus]GGL11912.1 N-acetyltransferase [Mangrovihabitans endophyticus]